MSCGQDFLEAYVKVGRSHLEERDESLLRLAPDNEILNCMSLSIAILAEICRPR